VEPTKSQKRTRLGHSDIHARGFFAKDEIGKLAINIATGMNNLNALGQVGCEDERVPVGGIQSHHDSHDTSNLVYE
jgi:hypothetical protein